MVRRYDSRGRKQRCLQQNQTGNAQEMCLAELMPVLKGNVSGPAQPVKVVLLVGSMARVSFGIAHSLLSGDQRTADTCSTELQGNVFRTPAP